MDILSDVKISGDLMVKDITLSRNNSFDRLSINKGVEAKGYIFGQMFCIDGALCISQNGIETATNQDFVITSRYSSGGIGIDSSGNPFILTSKSGCSALDKVYLTGSNSKYFTEVLPIGCTRFIIAGDGCPNQDAPKSIGVAPLVSIFGLIDGKRRRVEIDYEIGTGNCYGHNLIGQLSTPLDYCLNLYISII